ncbi:apolipoprotein N-acyltransferase [Flavisphingomonas formosensis]|uniref:apolipoprotein N-acyltransferase n=1 Tax=Flavisphingomonas formosensis TaxID=861534 RepID=UPI0038CD51E4
MPTPLIALLLGLVSALGFAPLDLWPITLIAFALLIHVIPRIRTARGALLCGWCFGLGHFTLGLNWIATAFTYQAAMPAWLGWVAVLLLSLYLAVYPALAVLVAWLARRAGLVALALVFGAGWIVTEWLRATMFTGFAWNPLGVTLLLLPAAGLTKLVGTYGLGAIVILAAATLAALLRRSWRDALLLALPVLVACGYGAATRGPLPGQAGPLIRVVQPNIGQDQKWSPDFESRNFDTLAGLSGTPGAQPRLVFWPEVAIPAYLEDEPGWRSTIAHLIGPRDLILTGGISIVWADAGKRKVQAAHNSLFVMDANERLVGRYDKAHLVPYGEYLPMRPILSALGLSRLAPGDMDFLAGPGPRTLALPGFGAVGGQICYEMIFSGQVVDRAHRPNFLFNPSNDAWFGRWGPPQHLAQARLRAIEEGLPVIRSTPTGISAVVDGDGRLLKSLPWRTAGAIDAHLPPPHAPTPFARFGNLLCFLFAGVLLIAAAFASRRKAG